MNQIYNDENRMLKDRRVLVVDDHRNIRISVKLALESEGAIVEEAENCAQARSILGLGTGSTERLDRFHCVFLDVRLPDGTGVELLSEISQLQRSSRVIMISGEGTVVEAFRSTQLGAFDFIEKPFAPERLLVSVRRAIDFNFLQNENALLQKKISRPFELIGSHEKMIHLQQVIKKIGPTNGRVLILGESGTGKELVARAVHLASQRAKKTMIKVNCAAIPHSLMESELFGHEKGSFTGAVKQRRGFFEQADGGTLFLDEIGELSLEVQAKLLRVLQNGEIQRLGSEKTINIDVRVIAATHRSLPEMVEDGSFREDLYYRLNVVSVDVPPLRDRKSDIPELAEFFAEEAVQEHATGPKQMSPEALTQLTTYDWPGNIRQLKNVIEKAVILAASEIIESFEGLKPTLQSAGHVSDSISVNAKDTPLNPAPTLSPATNSGTNQSFSWQGGLMTWDDFHQSIDRNYVSFVLHHAEGNVSEAARILCLERAYLHRLMKKLGIHRDVVVGTR